MENHHFKAHKSRILAEIASPNPDASPKGSIDVHILPLINRLNLHDRVFTTSSCSGRVSVFLEGLKKNTKPGYSEGDTVGKAGIGGKGEGGKWLFVSHDPVDVGRKSDREVAEMVLGKEVAAETPGDERMLGLGSGDAIDFDISSATRFVHLKFEPMVSGHTSIEGIQSANQKSQILHIQTSDLQTAHAILIAALSAGFRESGIMNPGLGVSSFPMVAIRCNGLAMDSIIGIVDSSSGQVKNLVNHTYLKTLLKVCNLRFEDNKRRIDTFSMHIGDALFGDGRENSEIWEDKEARKARKRQEGLKKQKELRDTM